MKKFLSLVLLLASSMFISGQSPSSTVSGTIVDEKTGEPLVGVSVRLDGTESVGAVANIDGAFTLSIPAGTQNPTLSFSLIGFKGQKIEVKGRLVMSVAMQEDVELLQEIVVVGHTTQKKGSIIGAVESVQVRELAQPTRTISTSLAGRLSGVIAIQSSGEPGNDKAEFWIRGVNTFTGSKTPLVLVDGIERQIDDVDPQEIESLSILKDATNTAVYGVRGGNGVVLITTKKGIVGKPRISFRTEMGFSNPLYLPKFADGETYMKVHNEALRNENRTPLFTKNQIERTANGYDPYAYPDVNWFDELVEDWRPTVRANLNVRGGSDAVRYFISGGFLNQNGMFKKFDEGVSFNNNIFMKRYNFRANVDANLTKTTILALNIAAILEDRNYPGVGTGGILGRMVATPPVKYPLSFADKTKVPGDGQYANPYTQLARSGFTTEHHTSVQSNMTVTQDLSFITRGLSAQGIFSFDNYSKGRITRKMNPRPYTLEPYGVDADGLPIYTQDGVYKYKDMDKTGSYSDYLTREFDANSTVINRSIYMEAKVMYNRTFEKHTVGGLFLYNQSDYQDIATKSLYESIPRRYQGLSAKASYNFDERYYGEVNIGYNGSENFAKGNRYGLFPAVAVGWVPTNESFMSFLKPAVSYMKWKVSYGEVGNDNLSSRFVYLTRVERGAGGNHGFGTNNGYGFGSGAGTKFTYYGNTAATWETAKKFDVGLELEFLKDFVLNIDYFHETRVDIWQTLFKTPDILGFGNDTRPGGNVGEMKNKGFDGFIEYNKRVNKDFLFSLRGTFVYAKNEVIANGVEKKLYPYQSSIGQPDNRLLGYISEGYFIDEADIANHQDQSAISGVAPKPGDLKYRDYNEDGVVDEFDRVYMGSPKIPEITYGINGRVVYKNFDASVLFQGAANVSFFAKPKLFNEDYTANVYTFMLGDYWTPEEQNLNARFPRLGVGAQSNNYVDSDHWMQNGRYLRLKTAELGYTLNNAHMKKVGISSLRLYLNGNNLFTISPFKWWDPEARHSTGAFYTMQRIVNFGVELTF